MAGTSWTNASLSKGSTGVSLASGLWSGVSVVGTSDAQQLVTGSFPAVIWSPIDKHSDLTLSENNKKVTKGPAADNHRGLRASRGRLNTDNGYFEVIVNNVGVGNVTIGIGNASASLSIQLGADINGFGYIASTGQKFTGGVGAAYGSTFSTGDIIGVAFKNGSLWFSKNGVWIGDPVAGTGAAYTGITNIVYPMVSLFKQNIDAVTYAGSATTTTYTAPSTFKYWDDGTFSRSWGNHPTFCLTGGTLSGTNAEIATQGFGTSNLVVLSLDPLPLSGKWYWEVQCDQSTTQLQDVVGIGWNPLDNLSGCLAGESGHSTITLLSGTTVYNSTSAATQWAGPARVGVAVDFDTGNVWVHINGTYLISGNPATATNPLFSLLGSATNSIGYPRRVWVRGASDAVISVNKLYPHTSQFSYPIPSGFNALCQV